MVVLSRWLAPVTTGASAMTAQASAWAARRPPSSRVSSPVKTTSTPHASADGSRSSTSDPGATLVISLATSGTNGG